jgi:hypothetical protein
MPRAPRTSRKETPRRRVGSAKKVELPGLDIETAPSVGQREREDSNLAAGRWVTLSKDITVKDLSAALGVKANIVIKTLVNRGIFATLNQVLARKIAERVAHDLGATVMGKRPVVPVTTQPADPSYHPAIMEYATVLAHAVDTFGSKIKAEAWLNRGNRVFNNRSPLQVLIQDPSAVEQELFRIDYGIIA